MAQSFSAGVYGTIQGSPPYINNPPFSQVNAWGTPGVMSFPAGDAVVLHPVNPGVQFTNGGQYIYSVIEVQPTGLNVHSIKYGSNSSVASLATLRNA